MELGPAYPDQPARMVPEVMPDGCHDLDVRALDDLGGILLSVTTAMLLDIDGWAQPFHVKALEVG